MAEPVTRWRGGGFDRDNNPVAWTSSALTAFAVAPGATEEYKDRGRNGDTVEYTVYFRPAVDLVNDDEMTVRGDRFAVQVEQWVSPYSSFTGTVALCTSGRG
jgi:hypothetical protein